MTEDSNISNDLNNPNDKFFKGALSLLIVAKPMIEEFTPKDLLDKLDLDTLSLDLNSYISDELKENFSDTVWSCQLKESREERKIAFLFEHKSYKPQMPHFQINDYQRGSWNMQMAAKQRPVPILPIVFYHGKDKWEYEPFDSYFGIVEPEMLRFLPCFDYILINLQHYSDEKIKSIHSIFLQKTLLSFKHYLDKNYLKLHIVELLFGSYEIKKDVNIRSFIQMIAVYLTAVSGMKRPEIIQLAKESNNNLKPNAMSFLDEIFEEGVEKGREEGREEGIDIGISKSIIKLYKKGMNAEWIAEHFDYPLSDVKQIITDYLVNKQNE